MNEPFQIGEDPGLPTTAEALDEIPEDEQPVYLDPKPE